MRPKTEAEIAALRESGGMVRAVLELMRGRAEAGIITRELAAMARAEIQKLGGQPVLLGYRGFPDVICISINKQVVHGLPGAYALAAGDVVSFDLCVGYEGLICDSALTVAVGGEAPGRVRKLLGATEAALYAGIEQVHPGARIGDLSQAIEVRLRQDNLGVVEDLVGHGVGDSVHEDPEIPNFGVAGTGPALKAGQTIAIEPMATLGGPAVRIEPDGWTVATRDGSLSAHFEHTVLVTDDSYEILTA